MLFTALSEIEDCAAAEHDLREEIDDGVRIQRRRLLQLSVAGCVAFGLHSRVHGQSQQDEEGDVGKELNGTEPPRPREAPSVAITNAHEPTMDFDELLAELLPLARSVTKEMGADEESFLLAVSKLLGRLRVVPEGRWFPGHEPGWHMDGTYLYHPLAIYQIEMDPGATITLHDHRDYNGVLLGVQGTATARHFQIHGRTDFPPPGERFHIRESFICELEPSICATLSRTRDNIHEIVAGREGCRLLDVFTSFSRDARSYRLDWDQKPVDPEQRIFEAAYLES